MCRIMSTHKRILRTLGNEPCSTKPVRPSRPRAASGGLPGHPAERPGRGFDSLGFRLPLGQTSGEQQLPVGGNP
ncbi:hypothetical protein E3U43_003101 [Larimichthys crocea]|uniref:Uncharacterized protein n=1 Tax=Larimichthys crocea TaxID=215358 RepID=A0ACD3RH85_LARCR|nr:hypothetical protein E3U43_003101 [Larimichthys crocea]